METKVISIASQWFEVKIKGSYINEEGTSKTVSKKYVVNASSWAEAESNAVEHCFNDFSGDVKILDMSIAPYGEIVFSENSADDKWFKIKVYIVTIDEKEREKKQAIYYLTNSYSTSGAENNIHELYYGVIADYAIGGVTDTPIVDVYKCKKD